MMMFQDSNNNPQEQEEKQQVELKNEPAKAMPASNVAVLDQEHLQQSQSQSQPPMPSDDMMRHSIADSLMEMLLNMTTSQYLHECLELLGATDPLQARSQILNILQRIAGERSTQQQP